MTHTDLGDALTALPPDSHERLRRLFISDQAERDAAAATLLRHPDGADPRCAIRGALDGIG